MYEDLDLSHLPLDVQDQVYSLVREFWSVFDGKGYTMPVLWRITSVLLIIDTGRFAPLWQRKSCTAIMRLLLCRCALPNCIELVIHDSFTMTSGCSRPCLPQNLIRNTSVILRILSGTLVSLILFLGATQMSIATLVADLMDSYGYMTHDTPRDYHQLLVKL